MTHEDDDVEHFDPADIEATIDDVERVLETGGVDPDEYPSTVIQAVLDEMHSWFAREILPATNTETMNADDVRQCEALATAADLVAGPNGPKIVWWQELGEAVKRYDINRTPEMAEVFWARAKRADPTGTIGAPNVTMTVI